MGNVHRDWGDRDNIYTVPGKVNCIVAKEYHQNNLLSFMQKTMQRVVGSNIRDEILGLVPYIYNNQATYQGSSGKPEVTLEISQILRELQIALHVT